ncbi:2Fe-2S iron-sulfur cluster-binding protein [Pseudomonas sp. BGr12]|uniref:2Fe-2S iron-sulfur cluster-binding protein n=1 Tax=Pseudomonas sp. BGr12 TaxID=2936269 RepID=UPI00255987B8|nr:2Fe-2S iron-sulfur cluster-binding protein [Pseudomonas sp. BJa5]MDL2428453.1 2Fe-2S iron-sulfur cluster-binding protein [Pseudomonas sp. BJa5]
MVTINFVQPDGSIQTIDAVIGATLMEAAVHNGVKGINADCGGACACATCHVYVAEEWASKVETASVMEKDLLDFAAMPAATSRLSCQVKVTADLEGLVINVPSHQC